MEGICVWCSVARTPWRWPFEIVTTFVYPGATPMGSFGLGVYCRTTLGTPALWEGEPKTRGGVVCWFPRADLAGKGNGLGRGVC